MGLRAVIRRMAPDRLTTARLDHTTWLPVPSPALVRPYARRAARALWAASESTPGPGEVRHFAGVLAYAMDRYPRVHPGFGLHFHIDGPRGDPLAVYTALLPAGEDSVTRLRVLTCADDADYAVDPPSVGEFTTSHLGTGLRVLRHQVDPDHGVITGLRHAWHVPERRADVLVLTSSPYPPRVLAAVGDIDAFAGGLRLSPSRRPPGSLEAGRAAGVR
jgi:hypothetical protein